MKLKVLLTGASFPPELKSHPVEITINQITFPDGRAWILCDDSGYYTFEVIGNNDKESSSSLVNAIGTKPMEINIKF